MATPHHLIGYKSRMLRVWGLKSRLVAPGLECETCHMQFTVKVLQELADTRAFKNIGTPDVHCCTLPPSTVRGSSNICDLLRQCGIQTGTLPAQPAAASTAPPDRIYELEHRGKMFRMHGIASGVVNSALSCNICKREFPLEVVAAMLDLYKGLRCRDITCCQRVTDATSGVGGLGAFANHHSAAQTPPQTEPKLVCRWCKGTGRVTLLTTSAPCDCVKQETTGTGWDALREAGGTVKQESVGVGWKVKRALPLGA